MKTRIVDPFGMASSTRTSAPDTSLLVLPRIDIIPAPPQPGGVTAQKMDRSPNRVGAHGDEFSSLRAYAIGDDLRKVHWPSSARIGELVVRNDQVPEHGHSLVLLDVRAAAADDATFELMVSAAASIVVACRERGDRIRFVTTAGVDHTADNAAGCDAILDVLALVEQTKAASVTLPVRVERNGSVAGALVVGRDSDALIASTHSRTNSGSGTFVVRFRAGDARSAPGSVRLTSGRMIEIEPGDDFASAWTRVVGR